MAEMHWLREALGSSGHLFNLHMAVMCLIGDIMGDVIGDADALGQSGKP